MKSGASIDRYSTLTEEILAFHHLHRRPFVISEPNIPLVVHGDLSFESLKQAYPDRMIKAEKTLQNDEAKEFKLKDYCDYACSAKEKEPYYVHLKLDATYRPLRESIHVSPSLFNWFDALPEGVRPHFFWILIGPVNSGTKMHVDMMNTSAWNYLIKGVKRWTFQMRKDLKMGKDLIHFHQQAGDLVYVPSKCPHSVINLSPTIALTENLLNAYNVEMVIDYFQSQGMADWVKILQLLKEKHDQSKS